MANPVFPHSGTEIRSKLLSAGRPITELPVYANDEPRNGVTVSVQRENFDIGEGPVERTDAKVTLSPETMAGLGAMLGCADEVSRVYSGGALVEIRTIAATQDRPDPEMQVYVYTPDGKTGVTTATNDSLFDGEPGIIQAVFPTPEVLPNPESSALLQPGFVIAAAEQAVRIAQRRIGGYDHMI